MTVIHRIEIPLPFPIGSVNSYFIEDSIPTLIDAGLYSDKALGVMESELKKRGYGLSDIQRILLTHGHLDHVGLAGKIASISKAKVFIHPFDQCKAMWNGRDEAKKIRPFIEFFQEVGLPETIINELSAHMSAHFIKYFINDFPLQNITEYKSFPFDDFILETIYCPGHTRGSVCFFDKKNSRLFSGDHLLQKITSNPVIEIQNRNVDDDYRSLSSYISSLEMIGKMGIKMVLPGHGEPFPSPEKQIEKIIHHHEIRREDILRVVRANKKQLNNGHGATLFSITQKIFPDLKEWDIFLGLSEVHGHIKVLENQGLIKQLKKNGQWLYHL